MKIEEQSGEAGRQASKQNIEAVHKELMMVVAEMVNCFPL